MKEYLEKQGYVHREIVIKNLAYMAAVQQKDLSTALHYIDEL